MDFAEIKTLIKGSGLDAARADNDDYLEVVVKKESIGRVMQSLQEALGQPAWPSKIKMPK